MPIRDIYSISCGRCHSHMGVCPGSQPMPSLYCTSCEEVIRAEMERDAAYSREYTAALSRS